MRRLFVFLFCLTAVLIMRGQSACPGFHNPTSFNTYSSTNYWSAKVGDRINITNTSASTGYTIYSTCATNMTPIIKGHANITSPTLYSGNCTYTDGYCGHTFYDAHDHRFQINTNANAGMDAFTVNGNNGLPRIPPGHSTSIRLGDMRSTGTAVTNFNSTGNGKGAEALFYTMYVTFTNSLLFIDYAVVARKYDHDAWQAGEFIIRVVGHNANGQWNNYPINDSLWFSVPAPHYTGALPAPWMDGLPGPQVGGTTCGYCYKPWARAAISLNNFIYDSVRVEMYTSDCVYNVDPIYAYIAGQCQPMQIRTSGCPTGVTSVIDTLKAPDGMLTYTWYVSQFGPIEDIYDHNITDTLQLRQVSPASTSNTYCATLEDFVIYHGGIAVDTAANQTFMCEMTSALDPSKPFHSRIYANVGNNKPILSLQSHATCDGTVTVSDNSFCPNQNTMIYPDQTTWSFYEDENTSTAPLSVQHGSTASYQYANSGNHAVRLEVHTSDTACMGRQDFTINSLENPQAVLHIDNTDICLGDSATLTDQTEGSVWRRWTLPDGPHVGIGNELHSMQLPFTNNVNPILLEVRNGQYYRQPDNLQDTHWCASSARDTIRVFASPALTIHGDTVVCNGRQTEITVSSQTVGCGFQWYRSITGSPISNGALLTVTPYADTCRYYIKVTSPQGCVAWDSINIYVLKPAIQRYPADGRICAGDAAVLTGTGAFSYHWSASPADPSLAGQEEDFNITVRPQQNTTYTLTGYGSDGCTADPVQTQITVIPVPSPKVQCVPGFIDSEDPTVTFTNRTPNHTGTNWYFDDGDHATGTTVQHVFKDLARDSAGITMVSANSLNCLSDTTFKLPIQLFGVWIPNIFTPNLELNTFFRISTANELEYFRIFIYDRRGDLVFFSEDQNFSWDGTHRGRACPQGAYVYRLSFRRPGTEDVQIRVGTITLIR